MLGALPPDLNAITKMRINHAIVKGLQAGNDELKTKAESCI